MPGFLKLSASSSVSLPVSRCAVSPPDRGFGRAAAPKAKRGPLPKDVLKDPDAPKKPSSAYNFYTKERTVQVLGCGEPMPAATSEDSRLPRIPHALCRQRLSNVTKCAGIGQHHLGRRCEKLH